MDLHGDSLAAGAVARMGTVRFLHGGGCHWLAVTPDGKTIVSSGIDGISIWDAATGKERRRFPGGQAALSPNGQVLATANSDVFGILLRDVSTGRVLRRLEGEVRAAAPTFSPDGRTLAASVVPSREPQYGDEIALWDVATGKRTRSFRVGDGGRDIFFAGFVDELAFSEDGKTLIVLRGGLTGGVGFCDVATGKLTRLWRNQGFDVYHSSFRAVPAHKTAVTVHYQQTIALQDRMTGEVIRVFEGNEGVVYAMRVSPDGRTVAAVGSGGEPNGGVIYLWDLATGKKWDNGLGHQGYLRTLAFFPDGKNLLTDSEGGVIRRWDLAALREIPSLVVERAPVSKVGFSSDGKTLVTYDHRGRTWDVASGRELRSFRLPHEPAHVAGFSPDGRRLWALHEEGLSAYEVGTGRELSRIAWRDSGVGSRAFSHDGRRAVTVGGNDRVFRLWDLGTGKQVRHWPIRKPGPTGAASEVPPRVDSGPGSISPEERLDSIWSLAFSPDGKTIVSGSTDGTFRLWETATGEERSRFGGGKAVRLVALSPDGRLLAAHEGGGNSADGLTIWDLRSELLLHRFRGRGYPSQPCFAFAPDGRTLAVSTPSAWESRRYVQDDAVVLCDARTGEVLCRMHGHRAKVNSLAFSDDGKLLASASEDTTALVWAVAAFTRRPEPARGPGEEKPLGAVELEAAWQALASADAARAYQAIRTLSSGPQQTVPFLKRSLRPVLPVGAEHITRLVAQLDHDQFTVRHQATEELAKLGDWVRSHLQEVLESHPSQEVHQRVERLLARLGEWRMPAEALRVTRAVEVLEQIGNPAAWELLASLARRFPEDVVGRDAAASLARLDRCRSPGG